MDLTATDFFCFLEYGGLLQKKHENAIITKKTCRLASKLLLKGVLFGSYKGKRGFFGSCQGHAKMRAGEIFRCAGGRAGLIISLAGLHFITPK
jgi:hypothetical protein